MVTNSGPVPEQYPRRPRPRSGKNAGAGGTDVRPVGAREEADLYGFDAAPSAVAEARERFALVLDGANLLTYSCVYLPA